jgi:hypothetical protein
MEEEQHLLTYDEAWQLQEILSLADTWKVLAFYQREPGPVSQSLADLDKTPEAVLMVRHVLTELIFLVTSRQSWEDIQVFIDTAAAERKSAGRRAMVRPVNPRAVDMAIRQIPITIVRQLPR